MFSTALFVTGLIAAFHGGECTISAWTQPSISTASGSGVFSTSPVNEGVAFSVTVAATSDAAVAYTLNTKTPDVTWAIDGTTGVLSLAAGILDYETNAVYTVEVVGTDADGAETVTCTLNLNDVNEAPAFTDTSLTGTIADAAVAGTALATYAATDPDAGDVVTYSIASGDCNSEFTIVTTTGAVSVATEKTLAASTTPCYSLVLNAVDDDTTPLTGSTTVLVTVGSSTCTGTYACAGAAGITAGIMTVIISLFIAIMK